MTMAHQRLVQRDESPDFDSREYYTIKIPNIPKGGLNAGFQKDSNGGVKLDQVVASSSENWQLFFQSGRFFIRNFDYGPRYQLGLTEEDRILPRLYRASGSISQQWTLNKVNGGWEMGNELWGAGARYALPPDSPTPVMRRSTDGAPWNITINFSASGVQPISGDWLNIVEGFEVRSTASSTILGPSTTSLASSPTNSIDPKSSSPPRQLNGGDVEETATPSPSSTSNIPTFSSSSPSLSGGAIAGIVVGAVALISAIIFAVWFFLMKKRHARNPYEVHGDAATEIYAHRAELAVPPAELPCRDKDASSYRAEM